MGMPPLFLILILILILILLPPATLPPDLHLNPNPNLNRNPTPTIHPSSDLHLNPTPNPIPDSSKCANVRKCSPENTRRSSPPRFRNGRITDYELRPPIIIAAFFPYPTYSDIFGYIRIAWDIFG